jgi:hypothetical protein
MSPIMIPVVMLPINDVLTCSKEEREAREAIEA